MILNAMPDVEVGIWNDEMAEWDDIKSVILGRKVYTDNDQQIQLSNWDNGE